jgi:hypothetical protein
MDTLPGDLLPGAVGLRRPAVCYIDLMANLYPYFDVPSQVPHLGNGGTSVIGTIFAMHDP